MKQNNSSFHTLNIPMNKRIVKKISNILYGYVDDHSKTWVQRIDVGLPEGTDPKMISTFNHRFIECEKNQGFDPVYVMAREIGKEGRMHYHMVLFLNGQKTENTHTHFENAKRILNNVAPGEGGYINYCNDGHRNGIMINRNDPDLTNLYEVERQSSYLAKIDEKRNVKGKTFFSSKSKKAKQ